MLTTVPCSGRHRCSSPRAGGNGLPLSATSHRCHTTRSGGAGGRPRQVANPNTIALVPRCGQGDEAARALRERGRAATARRRLDRPGVGCCARTVKASEAGRAGSPGLDEYRRFPACPGRETVINVSLRRGHARRSTATAWCSWVQRRASVDRTRLRPTTFINDGPFLGGLPPCPWNGRNLRNTRSVRWSIEIR